MVNLKKFWNLVISEFYYSKVNFIWLIGKDPDAGKCWRQKEKRVTENGPEFEKLQEIVEDRATWTAEVHGFTKS